LCPAPPNRCRSTQHPTWKEHQGVCVQHHPIDAEPHSIPYGKSISHQTPLHVTPSLVVTLSKSVPMTQIGVSNLAVRSAVMRLSHSLTNATVRSPTGSHTVKIRAYDTNRSQHTCCRSAVMRLSHSLTSATVRSPTGLTANKLKIAD
jgi:hypothetical protein